MKFDFDKYKGKYVMHCKTEEEAKEFCKVMHDAGMKWSSGNSYASDTSWYIYGEGTAYKFNRGMYGTIEFYQDGGYTILEWSDFRKEKEMTKKELKTGMVVEYRDGDKRMVLLGNQVGDVLICGTGWEDLDNYRDDLCHNHHEQLDIVAVYEPHHKREMNPLCWKEQKCIWRRSEVKEVTLSEIAEKFGVSVESIRVKE